ncbi:hypothetical protein Pelo_15686 [Pelomyxa schiedti]|nr:hypothetical protein Pelo_15686 [Pelomyxa schiedti]
MLAFVLSKNKLFDKWHSGVKALLPRRYFDSHGLYHCILQFPSCADAKAALIRDCFFIQTKARPWRLSLKPKPVVTAYLARLEKPQHPHQQPQPQQPQKLPSQQAQAQAQPQPQPLNQDTPFQPGLQGYTEWQQAWLWHWYKYCRDQLQILSNPGGTTSVTKDTDTNPAAASAPPIQWDAFARSINQIMGQKII